MNQESALIAKLKAQQAEIQKKIKDAQKAEKKKADALHDKKCLIVGRLVLEEMTNNADLQSRIADLLNTRLTTDKDRTLFDLSPLPDKTASKPGNDNSNKNGSI